MIVCIKISYLCAGKPSKLMAYKRHTITNGQYVRIEQTQASIGLRLFAVFIDGIVLSLYSSVFSLLIAILESGTSDIFKVIVIAIFVLIPVLYDPIMEQLFGGSLGKLVNGMKVVMQNGEAVTIGSSILRRMLYPIDIMGGIGLIAMFCNKKNMRLGDVAAGTIVIHTRHNNKAFLDLSTFTYMKDDYKPSYPWAADLSWGQIDFISQTMQKLHEKTKASKKQKKEIKMLAEMLAKKYHVTGLGELDYNGFLRTIVSDYNYYTWKDEL